MADIPYPSPWPTVIAVGLDQIFGGGGTPDYDPYGFGCRRMGARGNRAYQACIAAGFAARGEPPTSGGGGTTAPPSAPPASAPPSNLPARSSPGFRTMGEASGEIIWRTGTSLGEKLYNLRVLIGRFWGLGAVIAAQALEEILQDAENAMIGNRDAGRIADEIDQRAREAIREHNREMERDKREREREAKREADKLDKEFYELRKQQREVLASGRQILLGAQKRWDKQAKARSKAKERELDRAAKKARQAMSSRAKMYQLGAQALIGLTTGALLKPKQKGTSVAVSVPSGGGSFYEPIEDYGLSPMGLTSAYAAGLTSTSAATDGDLVCYRKSARKKRRQKRGTRRVCYDRKVSA